MAEPASSSERPALELSLPEARARFAQLARLAGLTGQVTVVTDGGRRLAAVVPVELATARPDPPAIVPVELSAARPDPPAAGWVRRIEKVRADLQRQHAGLEQALEQAWEQIDRLRPPGADGSVDALRAAHSALRRPR